MSSLKAFESATSLERFLNRSVLFVQGIDQNASKSEVLQVLNQVIKQPQQGRIDILTTAEGKMRGTAFLNFHNLEDAQAALDKWRFSLELRGRPLRMQFSSDREFKDAIQGPLVARFKILIRNLPEELTQEGLFEMFSQYGEIIQVHTNCDHYGQHYAIVQYIDVAAVQSAVRNAHREKVLSHVLLVEAYKPNATYGMLPRNINQVMMQQQQAPQQQQQQAAASGNAGGSSNGVAPPGSRAAAAAAAASLPGMTYAALQQQQEREMAHHERQAYAERHSDGGAAAAAAAVGTSNGPIAAAPPAAAADASAAAQQQGAGMAASGFYAAAAAAAAAAAGPLHSPTAPGSLAHLLSTAVHHVNALEEHLCCPITQEPLVDPVVAADGNTYERLAIEAWLQQHDTSPMTNEALPHKELTPNNLLRKIAEELKGISHPGAAADGAAGSPHHPPQRQQQQHYAAARAELGEVPTAAGPLAGADGGAVPIPVPVPVPVQPPPPPPPPAAASYNGQQQHHPAQPQPLREAESRMQHAQPPPPQQQQHYQQQQQHHQHAHTQHHMQMQQQAPPPPQQQQQQQQQQQYGDFVQLQVMRPQLVAAPVTFVQPSPHFQVQGTTYYTSYRPMGM